SLTTPMDLPDADGISIVTQFGTEQDDVPAVGMAFYASCDTSANPFACFSSDDPNDDRLEIAMACLAPNTTYLIRVWSGGAATDFSGTFRIGAFPFTRTDVILWKETFANGIEGGGWTTLGTCDNPDSNANAVWRYLPNGLLDMGAYIFQGAGISSPTLCDGAVGVDSDFDDNAGIEGNFGAGPCPAPGQYILVSPALYTGDWAAPGLSITWTQAIRQFQSTFFVSYRTNSTGGTWSDWTNFQINTEFETNGGFVNNNVQRLFMGGAAGHDSLQIRFVYNANYYMWGLDDICLVETEANNMRSQSNFFAIAPSMFTPVGQSRPWSPLNDIRNVGALEQTNVNLNFTVTDGMGKEIYNENLGYGTIGPDSLAENVNFPVLVNIVSDEAQQYTGTYTVTSDQSQPDTDFDFSDNTNSFTFNTTTDVYALENGFTRSVAVSNTIYDPGAPLSYAYGNYMYFPSGSDCIATSVTWGVNNPDDVAGVPINVVLFEWNDDNQNQIAEAGERNLIAFNTVVLNGDEGDNVILETPLENFQNQGAPIQLKDNQAYLLMVEYNAEDETFLFLLASEALDYGAIVLSQDQIGDPVYASVLGFSPDGNVQGIDYQVTELDVNDNLIYFGWDIVPLVRLNVEPKTTSAVNPLPAENVVELYPSPANREVALSLELTEVFDEVLVQVTDVTGKLMTSELLRGVQSERLTFDVSNFASGTYLMQVQTDQGNRTTRFVVQH
ncbi:MAG: T9SS type A sorting domain-containing protein, partial [Saprospiraceae bacterium]|nr:T9SS type A sorting domain-containing protein [Saprospiraceae bacterium]